ncbi:hypothetical protein ACLKA7_015334 [Drosophila subpalustris]
MPLFGAKKTTRGGSTASTVVRKSRNSIRPPSTKSKESLPSTAGPAAATGGQKVASPVGSLTAAPSDSDSEDDAVKNPEALPASDVTIYNEYSMGPAFGCKFPLQFIRLMIERLLTVKLKGKTYQPGDAVKWVRDVADEANFKMEGLCRKPRYKHVIQVIVYQQNGAGFFCGARAIWDKLADDYTTCTFDGGTFMCIVMIFGVYQY